jgi:hypothetical protein
MMNLGEARELRKELETIEATMERIKALWVSQDFPSPDDVAELDKTLCGIVSTMEAIKETAEELPTTNCVEDLDAALRSVQSKMHTIIEQVEELPTTDNLAT